MTSYKRKKWAHRMVQAAMIFTLARLVDSRSFFSRTNILMIVAVVALSVSNYREGRQDVREEVYGTNDNPTN